MVAEHDCTSTGLFYLPHTLDPLTSRKQALLWIAQQPPHTATVWLSTESPLDPALAIKAGLDPSTLLVSYPAEDALLEPMLWELVNTTTPPHMVVDAHPALIDKHAWLHLITRLSQTHAALLWILPPSASSHSPLFYFGQPLLF